MIASLGMYDFGPAQGANDRLWVLIRTGLRGRGIAAPESLTRGEHAYWDAWQSPQLILSQTCGYPFRARLHDRVTYVGTPDYEVDGCGPGQYRSVFVVREDDSRQRLNDFHGARFAYNEGLSQSGWAAPQTHAAKLGLRLLPAVQTGAHRLSAQAVVEGKADIAALDAVTHALMQACGQTEGLRVIAMTDPTPGLPCITHKDRDPQPIFDAVSEAIAALPAEDRATLRLRGFVRLPVADYLAVPNPPSPEQIAASI
jgi:ABC-type phosphate/phosphonate transport system substrate-binding protein